MSLKPFLKCLDTIITHITLEVLPVTIFRLTWFISVLERHSSVSYMGRKLWNSIPRSVKQSASLEIFENNFKVYLMLMLTEIYF